MKYKRSEYSRGVMSAEDDYKSGWRFKSFCHESFWITLTQEETTMQIQGDADNWTDGYIDYWNHRKVLSKISLDKTLKGMKIASTLSDKFVELRY